MVRVVRMARLVRLMRLYKYVRSMATRRAEEESARVSCWTDPPQPIARAAACCCGAAWGTALPEGVRLRYKLRCCGRLMCPLPPPMELTALRGSTRTFKSVGPSGAAARGVRFQGMESGADDMSGTSDSEEMSARRRGLRQRRRSPSVEQPGAVPTSPVWSSKGGSAVSHADAAGEAGIRRRGRAANAAGKANQRASRVGAALSDLTTRRVIVGVLFMMFVLPLLSYSEFDSSQEYWTSVLHAGNGQPSLLTMIQSASDNTLVRLTMNGTQVLALQDRLHEIRREETMVVELNAPHAHTLAVWDIQDSTQNEAWLSIGLTLLVLLVLAAAAWRFNRDLLLLVLRPLDKVIVAIRAAALNPLQYSADSAPVSRDSFGSILGAAAASGSRGADTETSLLRHTVENIAAALRLGFGTGGSVMLQHQVNADGEVDLSLPGQVGQYVMVTFELQNLAAPLSSYTSGRPRDAATAGKDLPGVAKLAQYVSERGHAAELAHHTLTLHSLVTSVVHSVVAAHGGVVVHQSPLRVMAAWKLRGEGAHVGALTEAAAAAPPCTAPSSRLRRPPAARAWNGVLPLDAAVLSESDESSGAEGSSSYLSHSSSGRIAPERATGRLLRACPERGLLEVGPALFDPSAVPPAQARGTPLRAQYRPRDLAAWQRIAPAIRCTKPSRAAGDFAPECGAVLGTTAAVGVPSVLSADRRMADLALLAASRAVMAVDCMVQAISAGSHAGLSPDPATGLVSLNVLKLPGLEHLQVQERVVAKLRSTLHACLRSRSDSASAMSSDAPQAGAADVPLSVHGKARASGSTASYPEESPSTLPQLVAAIHVDSAVEAAVGTRLKLDSGLQGPRVMFAHALPQLAPLYNASVLCTGNFVAELSPLAQAAVRRVDAVNIAVGLPDGAVSKLRAAKGFANAVQAAQRDERMWLPRKHAARQSPAPDGSLPPGQTSHHIFVHDLHTTRLYSSLVALQNQLPRSRSPVPSPATTQSAPAGSVAAALTGIDQLVETPTLTSGTASKAGGSELTGAGSEGEPGAGSTHSQRRTSSLLSHQRSSFAVMLGLRSAASLTAAESFTTGTSDERPQPVFQQHSMMGVMEELAKTTPVTAWFYGSVNYTPALWAVDASLLYVRSGIARQVAEAITLAPFAANTRRHSLQHSGASSVCSSVCEVAAGQRPGPTRRRADSATSENLSRPGIQLIWRVLHATGLGYYLGEASTVDLCSQHLLRLVAVWNTAWQSAGAPTTRQFRETLRQIDHQASFRGLVPPGAPASAALSDAAQRSSDESGSEDGGNAASAGLDAQAATVLQQLWQGEGAWIRPVLAEIESMLLRWAKDDAAARESSESTAMSCSLSTQGSADSASRHSSGDEDGDSCDGSSTISSDEGDLVLSQWKPVQPCDWERAQDLLELCVDIASGQLGLPGTDFGALSTQHTPADSVFALLAHMRGHPNRQKLKPGKYLRTVHLQL